MTVAPSATAAKIDAIESEMARDFVARVRSGATDFLADRGVYRSEQTLPIWHIDEAKAGNSYMPESVVVLAKYAFDFTWTASPLVCARSRRSSWH